MSFYDAIRVGASGAADFEVERSLRFNDNDQVYLGRTPSSAGNRKTFTFSAWVKRGNIGTNQDIFNGGVNNGSLPRSQFRFRTDDTIRIGFNPSASTWYYSDTTRVFRDVSAWYHLILSVDTTQSTSTDRVRLYVNGELQTFASSSVPSQNTDLTINNTVGHSIGVYGGSNRTSSFYDGYMAEINFIDGQQYDPSYFGETDADTGQWNPKKYTGSYGTNGFYLNFSDNSGTTATTLGKDSSGNGNNFTPNNFSVSAGTGNDSLEDTPTNNFATLNALKKPTNGTLSNGNLDGAGNSSDWVSFFSTILVSSGKWFCEVKVNATRVGVGIGKDGANENSYLGSAADTYAYFDVNGKWNNGSDSAYGATYTTNDIIGMALDMDAGTLIFYKNGASQGTAFTGLSGEFALGFTVYGGSASASINYGQRAFDYTVPTGYKALNSANLPDPTILLPNKHFDTLLYTGNDGSQSITGLNFQPDWAWIKERSGAYHHSITDSVRGVLKSLSSSRVDIAEYSESSGLNQFQSNGLGFNGRGYFFVNRDTQTYAAWNWNAGDTDSATYTVKVVSDSGNKYRFNNFGTSAVTLDLAEGGTYTFDGSDSSMSGHPFVIGTAANGSEYSTGVTYQLDGASVTYSQYTSGYSSATTRKLIITVPASAPQLYYWCSIHSGMGGAINTNSTLGSSNFDGSLQATVKANTTAGFSIGTYTAQSSGSATVGHGLGVAPDVVITKSRTVPSSWYSYHQAIGQDGWILLDSSGAATTGNSAVWNPAPTSSVFTYGSGLVNFGDVVFYAFSEVAGYSKFGSYTGNGSSDGTFVFTGFRPAWIMTKRSDGGSQNWLIHDIKRDPHNVANKKLAPNLSSEENNSSTIGNSSQDTIDILSNGFKMRSNNNHTNISGGTFIFLAFAEAPFKNARAR